MTAEPLSLEALLSQSWALFRRSPVVMAPFALMLLALVVLWFVAAAMGVATAVGTADGQLSVAVAVGAWVTFALVAIAASFAATFSVADAAWSERGATLRDAAAGLAGRTAGLILTWLALTIASIAAVLLAIPTLLLAIPLFGIVSLYAMPMTVLDGCSGFAALGASVALARATFRRTALVWGVLTVLRFIPAVPAYALFLGAEVALLALARAPRHGISPSAIPAIVTGSVLLTALFAASISAGYAFWALALTGWYRSLLAARESGWPSSASA